MPDSDEHRPTIDTERCSCGGQVVYFEDGDENDVLGYGCEVAGVVFPNQKTGKWRLG